MPNFTIPNKDALLCKHKRGKGSMRAKNVKKKARDNNL